MSEVLKEFPGAQRALFRRYHIGGCSSCGFQPTETLAQVCERYGGGGHARVGAISFEPNQEARAREAAREIVTELRESYRTHAH